ncbi:MAG: hypothetical protein ACE5E5_01265 [Phycisphaerae bacterium]
MTTYSVRQRCHKATVSPAGGLPDVGASAAELLDSFPNYFGAAAFGAVVEAVVAAVRADRPVVLAFGAHVLKVGCGPILIDLIQRGIVKALACNGACAIHDMELATLGETSEEVADTIRDGSFGMVAETMSFFDTAVAQAVETPMGLGASVGRLLVTRSARYADQSVFAAAHRASIPITVHVALGTDTIHMSHGMDSAALGEASMRDFRLICDVVSDLGAAADSNNPSGGVWLNIGSAVLLPEVFLKAVSVARNLGADLDAMTTANFDMIRHYRPSQNVITRPVAAGRGYEVVGHHEILLPLFRQALIEALK